MNKKLSKALYYILAIVTAILVLFGYFSLVSYYSNMYPDSYLLEEPLMYVNGYSHLLDYPIRLLCFALYGFLSARIFVRSKPWFLKSKSNFPCSAIGFVIGIMIGIISILPSALIVSAIVLIFSAVCNIDDTLTILRPTFSLEVNLTSMFLAVISYVIITEITIKKLKVKLTEHSD